MSTPVLLLISFGITVAYVFVFGLIIGGSDAFLFASLLFAILFIIITLLNFKKSSSILKKIEQAVIVPLVLIAVGAVLYFYCNQLHGTIIREYDTTVIYTMYRFGGNINFYDPEGNIQNADLNDYRPVVYDDEDFVEDGDTVHIKEYNGLFDKKYCVFDGEV